MIRIIALFSAAALASPALADPDASSLLFESPALEQVATGTTLVYRLERTAAPSGPGASTSEPAASPSRSAVELTLQADPDAGGRQAKVEIVTGERHQSAGPFASIVGNPVVLIMLERDVAEMSRTLRGSPFYLRNRIRESLGETTMAQPVRFSFEGREVEGWHIAVSPFAQDRNRDKLREYAGKRYEFTVSEAVPGRLYEIRTVVPGPEGTALLEDRLGFERSQPAEGGGK